MVHDLNNPHGCNVAIVGTGVSGMSAARLLESLGAKITLFDEKGGDELAPEALLEFDFAVLSPGFPRRKSAIVNALARGVQVVNEIDVAAVHLPECRFIGVTGTNGKSTTTAMIGDILRLVDSEAFVGGNLGKPLCEAVLNGEKPKFGVIELSSYQLETLSFIKLEAAVVTHLTPDHLDRYDSVADYYAAKDRIFRLLKTGGFAIINQLDPNSVHYLHPDKLSPVIEFNKALPFSLPNLIGAHNLENAAAAYAATRAIGIDEATIAEGLRAFKGLPHRLEFLGECNAVRWFNDSKATNVESAVIAVTSFESGVHLILGGVGKGSSYAPLVDACKNRTTRVYAIGEDAPQIEKAFVGHLPVIACGTLEAAVQEATQRAAIGDVILLAPACASFDQYPNYVARGEHLRQLFCTIKERN